MTTATAAQLDSPSYRLAALDHADNAGGVILRLCAQPCRADVFARLEAFWDDRIELGL